VKLAALSKSELKDGSKCLLLDESRRRLICRFVNNFGEKFSLA